MCLIDCCDPSQVSTTTMPKARKEYTCRECYRAITPGERYTKITGLSEGDWFTYRQCQHCAQPAELLMTHCKGYVMESILEDLDEHIHEVLPWSMAAARYAIGMRRQWRRFDGNGLMAIRGPK